MILSDSDAFSKNLTSEKSEYIMATKARNKRSLNDDEGNTVNGLSADRVNSNSSGVKNLNGPASKKGRGENGLSYPG